MNLLNEILSEAEQGSDLWNKIRLGKFTSSEIHKLICKRGDFTQKALTYINEKAAEILTGESKSFDNEATVWGHTYEPEARMQFEKKLELKVNECSFILLNEFYGGSPDGLIGEDALIEIKCPFNSANHIRHCIIESTQDLKSSLPEYYYQIQSNLLVTGRQVGFFVSYDFRVEQAPLYVITIPRVEADIKLIQDCVANATDELQKILKKLAA